MQKKEQKGKHLVFLTIQLLSILMVLCIIKVVSGESDLCTNNPWHNECTTTV